MKLINKFTLWYLCIALTCTIVGTAITYYSIRNKMDDAAIERLIMVNQLAANQLKAGQPFDSAILGRKVNVERMAGALPDTANEVSKSETSYPGSKKTEYRITVHSFFSINNNYYRITSFGYVLRADHLLTGLEMTIVWKWLLILFLIAISARLVSKIILSPFKQTLKQIEVFNLRQKQKIQLPATNTREFKELNLFVQSMTDRAVDEYIALKEFTENASHELQTPVAVMRMKLELLAESAITDAQALLITDVQSSLDKLSRINSSLVLLTRLENHEYATNEPVRFCQLINEALDSYRELMDMKSITLTKEVASGVYVQLNPMLGSLLMNNLLSNAIRHNNGAAAIEVTLTHNTLLIKNTGAEPAVPTAELFKRFKKGNQSSKSIGIGLAIVKQICDLHHFNISYTFQEGFHIMEIAFDEIEKPADAPVTVDREALASGTFQPAV